MSSLKIHPLLLGSATRPMARFCRGLDPNIIADFPLIGWYIEGAHKKILIDTGGGGDPSQAHPSWLPYKRESDQSIENALKKIGIRCEDIDIVINTHLHWDHTAGNSLFPQAQFIVQDEELRSARSPSPDYTFAYIRSVIENIDYTIISGDREIVEGVKVILMPGHTYGTQGVLVECETRKIFIASDNVPFFKNIEQDPPGISEAHVDLQKYIETLNRIVKLSASVFILPSHDFAVFEKEVYH